MTDVSLFGLIYLFIFVNHVIMSASAIYLLISIHRQIKHIANEQIYSQPFHSIGKTHEWNRKRDENHFRSLLSLLIHWRDVVSETVTQTTNHRTNFDSDVDACRRWPFLRFRTIFRRFFCFGKRKKLSKLNEKWKWKKFEMLHSHIVVTALVCIGNQRCPLVRGSCVCVRFACVCGCVREYFHFT